MFQRSHQGEDHLQQHQQSLFSRIGWGLALLMILSCGAVSGLAQHTVVKDIGSGRKLELDYDASDKVTQQRTIGPDGKVQEKVDFQYLPGYLGAQQTNTTY